MAKDRTGLFVGLAVAAWYFLLRKPTPAAAAPSTRAGGTLAPAVPLPAPSTGVEDFITQAQASGFYDDGTTSTGGGGADF